MCKDFLKDKRAQFKDRDPVVPFLVLSPKSCPQKDMYKNVHSNLIYNSPKLKTTV